MQYFGGKTRISKDIVSILNNYRKESQTYIEPFVGGGIVISKMTGKRMAYDVNKYLIDMYNAIQNGWIPPDDISKEEYQYIKNNKDEKPYLTGFVGFSCSYAGKWFGGYAKNKRGDNFCLQSRNSLMKKMETMRDVVFIHSDYRDLELRDSIVYCDPPYAGTTSYGAVGDFDSKEFWQIMREWSKNNTVIISEYNAPEDFKCIWQKKTKTEIRNGNNEREDRIEKLFIYIR